MLNMGCLVSISIKNWLTKECTNVVNISHAISLNCQVAEAIGEVFDDIKVILEHH